MKKIATLLATLCLFQSAHAQTITSAVPGFISYQGRALTATGALMGSGTPVNRTVTFRIWDHSSNSLTGNLLYSEQQVVTIADGEFSVLVGAGGTTAGTPLGYSETAKGTPTVKLNDLGVFAGANRFLGVTIDDGTAAVDNEASPRQQIVSSAYALRARYAEQLGSNGGTALTALDSGNVGIGNTNPPSRFTVTAAGIGTSTPQLLVTADDITERLRIGVDSTGSGTGFIQSFKEGTGAQNLLLNPNGGNVGIGGTATPAVALSVTGAITATGAITGASFSTAGGVTATGAITGGSLATGGSITGASLTTNNGTLGAAAYSELALGNIGYNAFANDVRLGISAYRTAATNLWTDTALLLGMNVDATLRPNAGFISIHGNGNVGIGTATPAYKLDVAGTAHVSGQMNVDGIIVMGTEIYGKNTLGVAEAAFWPRSANGTYINYGTNGFYIRNNASVNTMTMTNAGNVGIGTASPGHKLDVAGNAHAQTLYLDNHIHMNEHQVLLAKNSAGVYENCFWPRSGNGTYLNYGTGGFVIRNNASVNTMSMLDNGNVSIGSPAYNDARLNIGSSTAYFLFDGYIDGNGGQSGSSSGNFPTSIKAEGQIVGGGVRVFSDLRIKADLNPTDPVKDLETLMGIQVTNYHFKDTVANGNAPQKKVIAQQVEAVYPQAVNTTKGVVPDIYQKAKIKDGWVALATDLKVGDRVRLISDKEEGVHEVLEVKVDRFLTQFKPAGDQVFVYGREVNDFRSVDYDAIAMLNVSATQQLKHEKDAEIQELARQLETVQAENAVLRRELATKEQSMEARLIALERRMSGEGAVKTVSLKTARAAK